MHRLPRLLLLLVLLPAAVQAQPGARFTLEGRVIDAETGAPLQGANVFLANTMRGTATDSSGRFQLEQVRPGTYELVASMLGFAPQVRPIRALQEPPGFIEFVLEPVVYETEGILVMDERPPDWEKHLATFTDLFLGTSRNAARCALLNPYVLDFEVDRDAGLFRAWASAPLEIENRALGYRLTVVLETFETRDYHRQLWSRFQPLYEELAPRNDRELRRWTEARAKAYHGSMRHFLTALVQGRTRADGFETRSTRQPILPQRANWLASLTPVAPQLLVEPDSALGGYRVYFDPYLLVTYRREEEPRTYARFVSDLTGVRYIAQPVQHSILEFTQPAYIRADGFLLNPGTIVANGYWFWERLSERLPYDYAPRDEG